MRTDQARRLTVLYATWAILARLCAATVATAAAAPNQQCRECRSLNSNETPCVRTLNCYPLIAKLKDLADLRARLPEVEADLRAVMAQAKLDEATANAVIEAIRDGNLDDSHPILPGTHTKVVWMARRVDDRAELIVGPTLMLAKQEAKWDFIVEVPDPLPSPDSGQCKITVERACQHENPTFTIDIHDSHEDPAVTMAADADAPSPTAVPAAKWTIPDPAPYSHAYTFSVTAHGMPTPPRMARVFQFMIPKKCGNLTLVQELPKKQIAPGGPAATCVQQSRVEMCKPWCVPSVDPARVEVHNDVAVSIVGGWHDSTAKLKVSGPSGADAWTLTPPPNQSTFRPKVATEGCAPYQLLCHAENAAGEVAETSANLEVTPHDWTLRSFLVYVDPSYGGDTRQSTLSSLDVHEFYELGSGLGVGAAIERRINPTVGVEAAALLAKVDSTYKLRLGSQSGSASHNLTFFSLTLGPNIHLLHCKPADLYLGAFVGMGGFGDPNYWALGRRFQANFEPRFVWGGQVGVDVPFRPSSDWGFHAGLRYFKVSQPTDWGTIDVDPIVLQAGLSFRF